MKSSTSDRRPSIERRVARGERQRKWFFLALAFQQAQILALLVLVLILFSGRSDSREYYNNQIRMLVCAVPPGDETRNLLRERAHCGPYVVPRPPAVGRSRPASAARTPRPSSAATGEAQPASGNPSRTTGLKPSTRRTLASPSASRLLVTTRPVTSAGPARTENPSPTSTAGLLPVLLCGLLGCRTETP